MYWPPEPVRQNGLPKAEGILAKSTIGIFKEPGAMDYKS